jgi:signal transduction histidine kinase
MTMAMLTPYLKRFAALGTGLTDSYRFNPFIRTRLHIIGLHVLSTLLKIAVFWFALQYVQDQTVHAISEHIQQAVASVNIQATTTVPYPADLPLGAVISSSTLPNDIEHVRIMTFAWVFAGLTLLSVLFSYLLGGAALRPAKDSLQFQKRFIGNVAHEMRTPLAIMKTSTEVALMDPDLPPDHRATFEEIIVELNRVSETITNLLSFNTLIRPEQLVRESVDLGEVAYTVMTRHKEFALSRGIELMSDIFDVPAADRLAYGNTVALEQVTTNLVKNALNYTPAHQGGIVEIKIEPIPFEDRVALTIRDSGIGIADKDLFHIFEPFYRADTSRAREIGTGSSGLGLAIVNEIVRLHHGTITVRSAVGRGTTIKVTLPRARRLEQDRENKDDSDEDLHEVSMDFS